VRGALALAVLAVLAATAVAGRAEAIPAFARKYGAPCGLCHDQTYPVLNDFGRHFKENGYQFDENEAAYRAAHTVRPDPDERLLLLSEVPLSIRAVGRVDVATDPRNAEPGGRNAVDLRPFDGLYLLAGASVYPRVSLFASATIAPNPALHQAAVGFHDLLFGPGVLNLRFGRLLLLDFSRPEHRFLTAYGNPIATTPVGLNPTVLDSTQHGIDVYGRLLRRRLFYRLAVVQGAQGPDGLRDLDPYKDIFGELQMTATSHLILGALHHRGRTQLTDDTRGVQVRFTDRFHTTGASAELRLGLFDLFGQGLYVFHANPFGDGEHADYWAFRVEARAWLGPRFALIGRYDQLTSHHLSAQAFKHATVHLSYLLLTNLRIAAESAVPLQRIEASTLAVRVDVAL
jgi:hypothetical protein